MHACRACALEREKRYRKPEPLEVTGHLFKGESVTSLQIVHGSWVVEVHELLRPEGRVLHLVPEPAMHVPHLLGSVPKPLLCLSAHGCLTAAEITLCCKFTEERCVLLGLQGNFVTKLRLGTNSRGSEVNILIPRLVFM